MNKQEIDKNLFEIIRFNNDTIYNTNSNLKNVEVVVDKSVDIYLLLTLKNNDRVFMKYKFSIATNYIELEEIILQFFALFRSISNRMVNRKYTIWERILGKHQKINEYIITMINPHEYFINQGGKLCSL